MSCLVFSPLPSREGARGRVSSPLAETRSHETLQDLRSANGTLVNDRPVAGWTALEDGDIIRIGGTDLMFSAVDFADGETAFQHFRQRGEHHKSTIIMKESLES